MWAWTQLFEPGPALLLLIALLVPQAAIAAPFEHDTTDIEYYPVADSTGCYYNFQHYDEGDRIITNEPCLNCTCHNRMLMCYLRVCPFTKAIGQDCKVEKKADQCCPVITCPEVPVHLLPSTTQSSTAVGHLDAYGCSIEGLFYGDGARVPSNPNNPCELCYCIRNRTACVMQQCTLEVEGCKPVYQEGVCCPVRYNCEHPDYNLLETTTRRLITTTSLPTTTLMGPVDCIYNNDVYADGALIKSDERCERCYCMKGDIVCAVQKCNPTPLDKVNCTALPPKEGQCCPDSYECEHMVEDELTTGYLYTTASSIRFDELTTILPEAGVKPEEAAGVTPYVPEKESEMGEPTVPSTGKEGEVVQQPITILPVGTEKEYPEKEGHEKPSEEGTDQPIEQEEETEKPTEQVHETEEPIGQETEKPAEPEQETEKPIEQKPEIEKPIELEPETEKPIEQKPETEKPIEQEQVTEHTEVATPATPVEPEIPDQEINEIPEEHEIVTAGPHIPAYDGIHPEEEEHEGGSGEGIEQQPEVTKPVEGEAKVTETPEVTKPVETEAKVTETPFVTVTEGRVTEVPSAETEQPEQKITEEIPRKHTTEAGEKGITEEPQKVSHDVPVPVPEHVTESEEKESEGTEAAVTQLPEKPSTDLKETEVPQVVTEGVVQPEHVPAEEGVQHPTEPESIERQPTELPQEQVTTEHPHVIQHVTEKAPEIGTGLPHEMEAVTEVGKVSGKPEEYVTELEIGEGETTEISQVPVTEEPQASITQLPSGHVPKGHDEESQVPEQVTEKPAEESKRTEVPQEVVTEPGEGTKPHHTTVTDAKGTELPEVQITEEVGKVTELPQVPVVSDEVTETPHEQIEEKLTEQPETTEHPEEHVTEGKEIEIPEEHVTETTGGEIEHTELPKEHATEVSLTESPKDHTTQISEEKEKGTELPKDLVEGEKGTEVPEEHITQVPVAESTELPQELTTRVSASEGTEPPKEHVPTYVETESTELPIEHATEIVIGEKTEEPQQVTESPQEHVTQGAVTSEGITEVTVEHVTKEQIHEGTEIPEEHISEEEKATELPVGHITQVPAIGEEETKIPPEHATHEPVFEGTELPQEQITEKQLVEKVTEIPQEIHRGTKPPEVPEEITLGPEEQGKSTELPESHVTIGEIEEEKTTEVSQIGTEIPETHFTEGQITEQPVTEVLPKKPEYVTEGKFEETTKYVEEPSPVEGEITEQHPVEEEVPEQETEKIVPEVTEAGQIVTSAPSVEGATEKEQEVTEKPYPPVEKVTGETEKTEGDQVVTSAPSVEGETEKPQEVTEEPHHVVEKVTEHKLQGTELPTKQGPSEEAGATTVKYIPEKEGTELPTKQVPSEEAGATTVKYIPEKEGTELPQQTYEGTEKPQEIAEVEGVTEGVTGKPKVPHVPFEEYTGKPGAVQPTTTEEIFSEITTSGATEKEVSAGEVTEQPAFTPPVDQDLEHAAEEEHGIPGEGSCLVDGQTYKNNSNVPPINHCQISCKCLSSILQCESVTCTAPPSNLQHCMPVYQGPDSCCPTYSCALPGVTSMESDSHIMETTTKATIPGVIGVDVIISSEEGTIRPEVSTHGTTPSARDGTELPEFDLPEEHVPYPHIPEHGTELPAETVTSEIPERHFTQITTGKPAEHIPSHTEIPVVIVASTEKEPEKVTIPAVEEATELEVEQVTEKQLEQQPATEIVEESTTLKPVSEVEHAAPEYPGVVHDETHPGEEENEIETEDHTAPSYGTSSTHLPKEPVVTESATEAVGITETAVEVTEHGPKKVEGEGLTEISVTVGSEKEEPAEITTLKPSLVEGVTESQTAKPSETPEGITRKPSEVTEGITTRGEIPEVATEAVKETVVTESIPETATEAKQLELSTGRVEESVTHGVTESGVEEEHTELTTEGAKGVPTLTPVTVEEEHKLSTESVKEIPETETEPSKEHIPEHVTEGEGVTEAKIEEVSGVTTESTKTIAPESITQVTEVKGEEPEIVTEAAVKEIQESVTEIGKTSTEQKPEIHVTESHVATELPEKVTKPEAAVSETLPEQETEGEILEVVTEPSATEKIPESISHVTEKLGHAPAYDETATHVPEEPVQVTEVVPSEESKPSEELPGPITGEVPEVTTTYEKPSVGEEVIKPTVPGPEHVPAELPTVTTHAEEGVTEKAEAETTEKPVEPSISEEEGKHTTPSYKLEGTTLGEKVPEHVSGTVPLEKESTTAHPIYVPEGTTPSEEITVVTETREGTTVRYVPPESGSPLPEHVPGAEKEGTTRLPLYISEGITSSEGLSESTQVTEREGTTISPTNVPEGSTPTHGVPAPIGVTEKEGKIPYEKAGTTLPPVYAHETSTPAEGLPESSGITEKEGGVPTEKGVPSIEKEGTTVLPSLPEYQEKEGTALPPVEALPESTEKTATGEEGTAIPPAYVSEVSTSAEGLPESTEKETAVPGKEGTTVPPSYLLEGSTSAEGLPESTEKETVSPSEGGTTVPSSYVPESGVPTAEVPESTGYPEKEGIVPTEKETTGLPPSYVPEGTTLSEGLPESGITEKEGIPSVPESTTRKATKPFVYIPPVYESEQKPEEGGFTEKEGEPSVHTTDDYLLLVPEGSTAQPKLEGITVAPTITEGHVPHVTEKAPETPETTSAPEVEGPKLTTELTEESKTTEPVVTVTPVPGLPSATGTPEKVTEKVEEGTEKGELEVPSEVPSHEGLPGQEKVAEPVTSQTTLAEQEHVTEGKVSLPSQETLPAQEQVTEAEQALPGHEPVTERKEETQPPQEALPGQEQVTEAEQALPGQEPVTEGKQEAQPPQEALPGKEQVAEGEQVTEGVAVVTAQPGVTEQPTVPSAEGESKPTELPVHKPEEQATEYVSPVLTEKPEVPTTTESRPPIPGEGQELPVEQTSEAGVEGKPEEAYTSPTVTTTRRTNGSDTELYTSGPTKEDTTKKHIPGELSTSAPSTVLTSSTTAHPVVDHHEEPDYQAPVEEEEYGEEDQSAFGPGTCRYGGKVYVSAQQIPRDDPCDFCFCFRSDIICLQQSCPPPIPRCHEEPIRGFCCPRYECPVSMATSVNVTTTTTTTTTTLPPHFLSHAYKGRAHRSGCQIQNKAYKVGEVIKSASGPCLHCTCGGNGQMKCDPKPCSPEPMLRQMIAAAESRRRR